MTLVAVVVAGALGALVRAEVAAAVARRGGRSTVATAMVNLAGAFAVGIVLGLAASGRVTGAPLQVLTVGALGGLTTFSTWIVATTEQPGGRTGWELGAQALVGVALAALGFAIV